jgi:hypothetical protein
LTIAVPRGLATVKKRTTISEQKKKVHEKQRRERKIESV